MSRSTSADDSASTKKRYICPDCDKAFSTSSHLGRHSRVHTGEKNYKCSFPGCETRCSRQDNLQAHYRVHLAPQSRPKGTKKSDSGRSSASAETSPVSPTSSTSSSSPTTAQQFSPLEMYRTPASRFSTVSAGNSPQPLMPPQLPPSGTPRGPSLPLFDGYDGFSEHQYASIQRPSSGGSRATRTPPGMPYPRLPRGGIPPPIVRGSPDEALDGFNPNMLQDNPPFRRHENAYPPLASPLNPSMYPYHPYPGAQHPSMSRYPPNVPGRNHTPSPPLDFPELHQLPR
ncbi:hypothetical protein B0H11DRAFT_1913868 [Mycena galericulata]|nr:hypothetical protein B0H11DRAFT_1913868 [Mycena galericulata]